MYYRMSTFSYDPIRKYEVTVIADSARGNLKAISGLQSEPGIRIGYGKSVTIAIYDSKVPTTTTQPEVQKTLKNLASVLIVPPEIQQGSVI